MGCFLKGLDLEVQLVIQTCDKVFSLNLVFLANLGKCTCCRWLFLIGSFSYLRNHVSEENRLILIFMCLKLRVSGWSHKLSCGLGFICLRNGFIKLKDTFYFSFPLLSHKQHLKWLTWLLKWQKHHSKPGFLSCTVGLFLTPTDSLILVVCIFSLKKMLFRCWFFYRWFGELRQTAY